MRLLFLAVTFTLAQPLEGQWHARYLSPRLQPIQVADRSFPSVTSGARSTGRLVAGGVLGAAAGLGIALLAYSAFDRQDPCLASDCDSNLGTGLVAATAGLTVMTPLGVHLADSRRGSFLKGLLYSAGVAALGWGGAALADDGRWLLLIPPAQIVAAVLAERSSTQ
jgi:hypothetical protein